MDAPFTLEPAHAGNHLDGCEMAVDSKETLAFTSPGAGRAERRASRSSRPALPRDTRQEFSYNQWLCVIPIHKPPEWDYLQKYKFPE